MAARGTNALEITARPEKFRLRKSVYLGRAISTSTTVFPLDLALWRGGAGRRASDAAPHSSSRPPSLRKARPVIDSNFHAARGCQCALRMALRGTPCQALRNNNNNARNSAAARVPTANLLSSPLPSRGL